MRSDHEDSVGARCCRAPYFIDGATPALLTSAHDEAETLWNFFSGALDNLEILAFIDIHAFTRRTESYVTGNPGSIPGAKVRPESVSIKLFVLFEWCRKRKQNAPQLQCCRGLRRR